MRITYRHVIWVIAGAAIGSAVGAAQLLTISNEPIGGRGFISQAEFEEVLHLPPIMDRPRLRSIVIHHRSSVDLISFEILEPATLQYRQAQVAVPRSFVSATDGLSGTAGRAPIREYLRSLAPTTPGLTFTEARWEGPLPILALSLAIGILLVGLVCPRVLRLGRGATLPMEEFEDGLSRLGRKRRAQAMKASDDDAKQRLEELEAAVVAALPAGSEPDARPTAVSPLIRDLASDESTCAMAEVEIPKDYAGEYYPVEKRAPAGFSLTELIVVIGIIGVLLVVLLPAVHTARLHSQTVQCATQLRQLGHALQLYAANNQGWLPAWSGWHTWPPGGTDDSVGPAWTIELMPYLGSPDSPVYNCPSFPGPVKCRNYFLAGQWSGRSGRNCMKLAEVTMSSQFVLSGDKTQMGLYPPPWGTGAHLSDDADPDDSGTTEPVLAWPWDPGGFYMHRGGNNVLFDDMHVALFAGYDPQAMTFNPHRRQNWADVTGD